MVTTLCKRSGEYHRLNCPRVFHFWMQLISRFFIQQLYAKVDNIINVNRNDFRPPPQVESSVIRLVPIDPPPPVKFEEFDGMNRIIFSRPNKTIRGNFQAKGVMKMLEQNRRTWLSMQDMVSTSFTAPLITSEARCDSRCTAVSSYTSFKPVPEWS